MRAVHLPVHGLRLAPIDEHAVQRQRLRQRVGLLSPRAGTRTSWTPNISTTMPSTTPPSSICTTLAGMARPSMAPAMELAAASTASGSARRRLPRPPRSSVGPAARRWPAPPAGRRRARSRGERERSCRRWARTACRRRCPPAPPRCPSGKHTTNRRQRPHPPGHGVCPDPPPPPAARAAWAATPAARCPTQRNAPGAADPITTPPGSRGSAGGWPARRRTSVRPAAQVLHREGQRQQAGRRSPPGPAPAATSGSTKAPTRKAHFTPAQRARPTCRGRTRAC
jgi:hypothetical protein